MTFGHHRASARTLTFDDGPQTTFSLPCAVIDRSVDGRFVWVLNRGCDCVASVAADQFDDFLSRVRWTSHSGF